MTGVVFKRRDMVLSCSINHLIYFYCVFLKLLLTTVFCRKFQCASLHLLELIVLVQDFFNMCRLCSEHLLMF